MTLPSGWVAKPLSEVVTLQRGFDLPFHARRAGSFPVLTSGETSGNHDEGPVKGPGMIVGRATNLGRPKWSEGDFWPHNTTMYVKDFCGNVPRWVYHLFENTDLAGFNSGSVQPMLNRNYIAGVPVVVPPLPEQQAIAEVLGALDDKIAANTKLARTAAALAQVLYDQGIVGVEMQPMSAALTPILGGTPARGSSEFWGGNHWWASAKDITGASNAVILSTEETISAAAVAQTKAKPLPIGSVILTARGTVGAVARLSAPASFNQSCYGFTPDQAPPSILYFGILNAMQRAKAIAHGSVFDTITMKTFDHLDFPHFVEGRAEELDRKLRPMLDSVVAMVKENRALAELRDTLLPELMSGRLRVKDAEAAAAEAGL